MFEPTGRFGRLARSVHVSSGHGQRLGRFVRCSRPTDGWLAGRRWQCQVSQVELATSKGCCSPSTRRVQSLVAWDLDNIRPPKDFRGSVQTVLTYLDLSPGDSDVLLAANTWTVSKVLPTSKREEIDSLLQWGANKGLRIEFIETERRRQAVDRELEHRIIDWINSCDESSESSVYIISNDSDFAQTLSYVGNRANTVVIGTCRPTRNSNAARRKPNIKLSEAADRTLRIDGWGSIQDSDGFVVAELH